MARRNEYDISLTIGSTDQGFMLASAEEDGKRRKLWRMSMPRVLSNQQFTSASYDALEPEEEIVIVQDEFRGGFGELNFRDVRRYAEALGCDARWEGQVIPGPLVNTTTLQTQLANVDFEAGALTSWTVSGGTPAISTAQAHAGTYSAKITGSGNYLEQGPTWVAALFQSCSITLTAWVWCDTASRARIQIVDSTGTYSSDYHTGGSTWEQLTITQVVGAAATSLTFHLIVSGGTAVAYFDDVDWTFQSMTAPLIKYLEVDAKLFMLTTTAVYEWDNSNTYWVPRRYRLGASETFTDMERFGSFIYAAKGDSVAYEYSDDGAAWTVSTLASNAKYATYFANLDSITLWKSRANAVASSTNPANAGSWATEITAVNATTDTINSLVSHREIIWVGATDGLYYINSSNVAKRYVPMAYDSNNCKVLVSLDRDLIFVEGNGQLKNLDEAWDVSEFTPRTYGPRIAAFARRITAFAYDGIWYYAFVQGQSADNQTYIMAARWENINGTAVWVWHPITRTGINDLRAAHRSTLQTATGRLWFGGQETNQSNRNRPSYCLLPALVPQDDSAYRYNTDATNYFITGYYTSNFSLEDKAWFSMTLESNGLSSTNRTCVAEWQKDGDTSWTNLGTFNTSPSQTKYFAADTYGKKIRFRFTLYTDSSSTFCAIYKFSVKGILKLPARKYFDVTVRVGDSLVLTDGIHTTSQPASNIRTNLNTARASQWPLTLWDFWDNATSYRVELLSLEAVHVTDEDTEREQAYRLIFREVLLA